MPFSRAWVAEEMCAGGPVDPDLALVQLVHPADALDQGRLAGAVVAEQGQHLPGVDLEVDTVEGHDGAEQLRRTGTPSTGCRARRGAHASLACRLRNRFSKCGPDDVELDRDQDDDAGGDVLPVGVEAEQVEAVVHHAEDQGPGQRVDDAAPAAKEATPTDDDRRDRVQLHALGR